MVSKILRGKKNQENQETYVKKAYLKVQGLNLKYSKRRKTQKTELLKWKRWWIIERKPGLGFLMILT